MKPSAVCLSLIFYFFLCSVLFCFFAIDLLLFSVCAGFTDDVLVRE